jgi:PAS domain S-box-containing protein
MNPASLGDILKPSKVGRHFTMITVMFLSVLLGILVYTITTIQNEKSNAILIDMAGRQRMLLQKHINEVFLTSQGITADYMATRKLIHSTLHALMEGGSVVLDSETGQRHTIPAVPTEGMLVTLRNQQKHLDKIIKVADDFLLLSPEHPEFGQKLETLRAQNSTLIRIADDAVKQLSAYSESNLATMLKWETIIAIVVGLLGMFVTGQGVRVGRRLENEIAERKRAESALRNSELFLNSIVENIPHMIFVKTATDLRFVRINKEGEDILGCSRKELLGKSDYDLFPREQADFFTAMDREVLTAKNLVDIPKEPIQTKTKGLRHLHTKKIPLLDDQGIPQYLLGISEDITERLQAQESLRRSEERYRVLYEDNPSMYFTVARDGTILSVNRFGAQQLGYQVEDLVGQPVIGVFHEEDKPRVRQHFADCLKGTRMLSRWELRKQRKDGSVLYVREVARTVQGEDGETVVLIVCEDITEWKQTEERLRESEVKRTEALRQSDELKSALLSSVSHELRTPLTAMKASVSSIIGNGTSGMNEVQHEFLKGVDKEINYMSRLVDNLLDMSRIEAGTLMPHREWHPLEDLVEGALRRAALTLEIRNIEVHIPEDLPPVFVDAVEMQQVLINLLDNAVKYSFPDSPIRIQVRVGVQYIEVEVSNTGEAIPAQDLERIFERFYRRRSPREQSIRGTGLGLAICKGIVKAHGGRIWAQSIKDEVKIIFTIPVTESMASFSLEGLRRAKPKL